MKALALIVLATIALIVAPLLWHAPRCTGPTPADRCPLAGGGLLILERVPAE
jgi:hypothetical protein